MEGLIQPSLLLSAFTRQSVKDQPLRILVQEDFDVWRVNLEGAGLLLQGPWKVAWTCIVTLALGLSLRPQLLLWALSTLLGGVEMNCPARHFWCFRGTQEFSERWNTFPISPFFLCIVVPLVQEGRWRGSDYSFHHFPCASTVGSALVV